MANPYETLNVPNTASSDEIKKAFRNKAKEYHPDKTEGKTSEEFKAISAAYTLLMNPKRRSSYDANGNTDDNINQASKHILLATAAFKAVIDRISPTSYNTNDLITITSHDLKSKLSDNSLAFKRAVRDLEAGRKALSKIHCAKDADNILLNVLKDKVQGLENHKDCIAENTKIIQAAIEYLKQYSYTTDEAHIYKPGISPWLRIDENLIRTEFNG